MIYYVPEGQIFSEYEKPRERRYYCLPSGGIVAVEAWENDQYKVVEVISTDLNDYMNSSLQPGSILHLRPEIG